MRRSASDSVAFASLARAFSGGAFWTSSRKLTSNVPSAVRVVVVKLHGRPNLNGGTERSGREVRGEVRTWGTVAPRVSRRLETVAESCAVTDGPSKETSRSARASGRAVLAEGARLWRDFPEIRPGHALLADRTGRTSERRAARSCSLILSANPSPPRMLRARDRRGPVVILPGTRGVASRSPRCYGKTATRRDGLGQVVTLATCERVESGFAVETTRPIKNENARFAPRRRWQTTRMMFDTTTPP